MIISSKFMARLFLLLVVMTGLARASIIVDFDDITTAPVTLLQIPWLYKGLNWENLYILDAANYYDDPSGYRNALVSGSYVAWGLGRAADRVGTIITPAYPGTFDFIGCYLTSACRDDLNLAVEGSLNDILVYTQTVILDADGATWFDFNYTGIDHLRFIASGGVVHYGDDPGFAMDDFTFIPEPASVAIIAFGTLGLRLWRKQQ